MFLRYVLRLAWVAAAFCIAAGVALAVLFALGAMWAGGELRSAAPHDPLIEQGGAAFGAVLFIGTVTPALTALPGLIAVVIGEVLRIRSWIYYVLAGGAALAAVPLLAGAATGPSPSGEYMTIFAAAGFAGGLVYWLLAGARA